MLRPAHGRQQAGLLVSHSGCVPAAPAIRPPEAPREVRTSPRRGLSPDRALQPQMLGSRVVPPSGGGHNGGRLKSRCVGRQIIEEIEAERAWWSSASEQSAQELGSLLFAQFRDVTLQLGADMAAMEAKLLATIDEKWSQDQAEIHRLREEVNAMKVDNAMIGERFSSVKAATAELCKRVAEMQAASDAHNFIEELERLRSAFMLSTETFANGLMEASTAIQRAEAAARRSQLELAEQLQGTQCAMKDLQEKVGTVAHELLDERKGRVAEFALIRAEITHAEVSGRWGQADDSAEQVAEKGRACGKEERVDEDAAVAAPVDDAGPAGFADRISVVEPSAAVDVPALSGAFRHRRHSSATFHFAGAPGETCGQGSTGRRVVSFSDAGESLGEQAVVADTEGDHPGGSVNAAG